MFASRDLITRRRRQKGHDAHVSAHSASLLVSVLFYIITGSVMTASAALQQYIDIESEIEMETEITNVKLCVFGFYIRIFPLIEHIRQK